MSTYMIMPIPPKNLGGIFGVSTRDGERHGVEISEQLKAELLK